MLEKSLSLSSLSVNLVNADLLVPRRDREMVGNWREGEVRDAVFWWVVECNILAEVAQCVRRARSWS